jgi:hypothetical protein
MNFESPQPRRFIDGPWPARVALGAALKQAYDRTVSLLCADGELIVGDIVFVSEENQEVLYDLVSSNRPELYHDRWVGFHVFSLPLDQIVSVTLEESWN